MSLSQPSRSQAAGVCPWDAGEQLPRQSRVWLHKDRQSSRAYLIGLLKVGPRWVAKATPVSSAHSISQSQSEKRQAFERLDVTTGQIVGLGDDLLDLLHDLLKFRRVGIGFACELARVLEARSGLEDDRRVRSPGINKIPASPAQRSSLRLSPGSTSQRRPPVRGHDATPIGGRRR